MIRLLFGLILFSLLGLNTPNTTDSTDNTTTYYFIRHAEKIKNVYNPDLLPKGQKRAKKWAAVFKDIPLDAVYSTDYKRTINTALPTAQSKELPITKYHALNIDYDAFLKDTKGKKVLIVGHSNTIPAFVNRVIGYKKYGDIVHNNNANLYIVTLQKETISDMLLFIE